MFNFIWVKNFWKEKDTPPSHNSKENKYKILNNTLPIKIEDGFKFYNDSFNHPCSKDEENIIHLTQDIYCSLDYTLNQKFFMLNVIMNDVNSIKSLSKKGRRRLIDRRKTDPIDYYIDHNNGNASYLVIYNQNGYIKSIKPHIIESSNKDGFILKNFDNGLSIFIEDIPRYFLFNVYRRGLYNDLSNTISGKWKYAYKPRSFSNFSRKEESLDWKTFRNFHKPENMNLWLYTNNKHELVIWRKDPDEFINVNKPQFMQILYDLNDPLSMKVIKCTDDLECKNLFYNYPGRAKIIRY